MQSEYDTNQIVGKICDASKKKWIAITSSGNKTNLKYSSFQMNNLQNMTILIGKQVFCKSRSTVFLLDYAYI